MVAAWAAVLIVTAGVGTGIAVMADDPKPKAGEAPVAAAPVQPDKPLPATKPAEKADAEQERRKELGATIDQLLIERGKLKAKADELQQLIAREQRQKLNPQIIRAMEALLTEIELTIFRTEMELLTQKDQRLAQAQREYDEARGRKVDPAVVDAQAARDPAVVRHHQSLQQAEVLLQELSTRFGGDHPEVRKVKDQIRDLTDKLSRARLDARAKATDELIEAATRSARVKLDDAKQSARGRQDVLLAAHQKRDDILKKLDNDQRQSAEIQRLEAELQTNREMARRLSLLAMELELKLKGLPVPDAPRPAASDDKLDRVLRELSELRAEVRRLSEKK
jgi:hypothetical protein